MKNITLESLIQEHNILINSMIIIYGHDQFQNPQKYEIWLAKTRRYLALHYANDKQSEEFDNISRLKLSKSQQQKMLAILNAFMSMPKPIQSIPIKEQIDSLNNLYSITINNSNSQSQSQEQTLAVQLFIDAIKDNLTGSQIKELKAIVDEADNDLQKARSSILSKVKEFGIDVVSNIFANLITNPAIWSVF